MAPKTPDIVERLEVLRRKLDADGQYVSANTAALAAAEICRLREESSG